MSREAIPQMSDIEKLAVLEEQAKATIASLVKVDSKEEFYAYFTPKNEEHPEIHGGFALSHWSGEADVEKKIKDGVKYQCTNCTHAEVHQLEED